MTRIIIFLLLGLFLIPQTGAAHTRSQSASRWQADSGKSMTAIFQVDSYRATLLQELYDGRLSPGQLLTRHLADTLVVTQSGQQCKMTANTPLPAARSRLRQQLAFLCQDEIHKNPPTITVNSFFTLSAVHQHVLHLTLADHGTREQVLTIANRSVRPAKSTDTGFWSIVIMGAEHVASGPDHILFLMALLLYAQGWRRIFLLVSCFTLGHMLSLFGVAFDWLAPDSRMIEALIGLSILSVALHALARHTIPPRWFILAWIILIIALITYAGTDNRVAVSALVAMGIFIAIDLTRLRHQQSGLSTIAMVTLLFSLAHGAGFAGPLADLNLPVMDRLPVVLFFNIGVEIAQLLIIASSLIILHLLSSQTSQARLHHVVQPYATAIMAAIGLYWFTVRLIT